MGVKFDHCVIHVSDWERSRAFYREGTGAEVALGGAGWVYRFRDTQLGPGPNPVPVARIPVQPGHSDLCFERPGPIPEAAEYKKHRVEIEPVQRLGAKGERMSVYFRDPGGTLLEFISYTPSGM